MWSKLEKPNVTVFENDHQDVIYVINNRDDQFIIIKDDPYEQTTGLVEILTEVELLDKYNLKLGDLDNYKFVQ